MTVDLGSWRDEEPATVGPHCALAPVAAVRRAIADLEAAIMAAPVNGQVRLTLSLPAARGVLTGLQTLDPDAAPFLPLARALGPIAGDLMLGAKLDRLSNLADFLSELADRLDTQTMRAFGAAVELQSIIKTSGPKQ